MIDNLVREEFTNYVSYDPFEHGVLNDGTSKDENPEVAMSAQVFKASAQAPPTIAKVKELMNDDKDSFDGKQTLEVELKPLPFSLRYEFLSHNSTYHMIVNINLSAP